LSQPAGFVCFLPGFGYLFRQGVTNASQSQRHIVCFSEDTGWIDNGTLGKIWCNMRMEGEKTKKCQGSQALLEKSEPAVGALLRWGRQKSSTTLID
jgi:hypothetical protein